MSFDNPSILISRNLNLLEYQSKGLLENYGVTVQKFKMAGNADEVKMGVSKINDVHLKSSCWRWSYTYNTAGWEDSQIVPMWGIRHQGPGSCRRSWQRSLWQRVQGDKIQHCIRGRKRFILIREVCTWPRTPVWWQVFAMPWLETSWSPSRLHLRESLLARLLNLAVGFCFSICDLKVMVAEAIDITRETYFCIAMDRDSNGPVIVARWEIALK